MRRACVLGGGSFGTALAQHLACQGLAVTLWVRHAAQAEAICTSRHNPTYLHSFRLHDAVLATACPKAATRDADLVLIALPSQALRPVLGRLRQAFWAAPDTTWVLGTKGLEPQTLMTMHEVCCEVLGHGAHRRLVVLSGPSFAREIMLAHPTAVVVAGADLGRCQQVAGALFCDSFRAYCATDVVGVEMGGALKNVMAIAAGALVGLGLGDNSRAALVTRGLAEITRMAVAKGGQAATLSGLAGLGDLVLTCTGGQSRNRRLGEAVGEGCTVDQALRRVGQVAEGALTARAAYDLALRLDVDAPIIGAVYRVLYAGQPVREAMLSLVRRAPGFEY